MQMNHQKSLKELRESRGLSRREVSQLSGINLRSLQDYEQGHKQIISAKGETLYRLSLALGCTIEDLLDSSFVEVEVNRADPQRQFLRFQRYYMDFSAAKEKIEKQELYCKKYHVYGKWKLTEEGCMLVFIYDGELVQLPFRAVFSEKTYGWLADMASMHIENYIENIEFEKKCKVKGEKLWNE